MLLKNIKEVNRFLPSNVIKNFDMISSFITASEKEYIIPVLGKELYKELKKRYDNPADDDTSGLWNELLESVQYPLVNFAMHKALPKNNVTMMIGGAAVAVSQNMEVASQKRIDALSESLYEDAQKGIDQLLIFLEEDSLSDSPVFKQLWEKSRYFYQMQGSLINTAAIFQEYVNIMGSRAVFVKLKPNIAYCEKVYIRPELSNNLIDYLIENDGNLDEAHMLIQAQIRNALAYYVADRDSDLRTDYYKNNAKLLLSDVRNEIFAHPDKYPAFKESPLYIPSSPETTDEEIQSWENGNDKHIFILGGTLQN